MNIDIKIILNFYKQNFLYSKGKKQVQTITKIVKFILVPIHKPKKSTANSKYFFRIRKQT